LPQVSTIVGTKISNHATGFSLQLMTKEMSADLEWDRGQGTRGKGKWEGETPAEPDFRQIVRSANRQVGKVTDSEWRIVSLEGSAPALPKIFGE